MIMAFKVSYYSFEHGKNYWRFTETLKDAVNFVSKCKKANVGKDFKIIPIKFK